MDKATFVYWCEMFLILLRAVFENLIGIKNQTQ
jgi:hypothetical protein